MLSYIAWEQVRERNKALDTFVGASAMRKSLPRFRGVDFAAVRERIEPAFASGFGAAAFACFAPRMRQPLVYAFASLKLRRTRFALTVFAWLRHA